LVGSLLFAAVAFAGPYGSGHGMGRAGGMMTDEQSQQVLQDRLARMAVILDLDDSQQVKIQALLSKHWQSRQADREVMRAGRDTRQAAMRSGNLDETTIRSNMAKRAEYQADRMVGQAQIRKEVYAILTPEQQAKAEKLMETGMNGGRGHRMNGFNF